MIEVDGLVKRYRTATRNAVDGISFRVEPGEFFALLGPNGAGKTTTLSVLTTTLLPTAGRALVAGHDVVSAPAEVRRSVGIIFQKPSLDRNLSGEENVRLHAILYGLYPYAPAYRLMAPAYRSQVEESAAMLGLGREIFDPVRTYSGGMLRKLEIVRSLMHRPRVLFLDEPTSGLDAPSRRTLWEHLARVRQESGTTIVLTSHYLEEAEQADRITIMSFGRIVATGTPAGLKADLAHETLRIDADDRAALRAELARMGLEAAGDGPFTIPVRGRETHAVLRAIETPLTLVRTDAPSLEDVYLEIVTRAEDERAEVDRETDEAAKAAAGG
ncbi:MAG TPA: ABC transporter ATP-binding protein [Candidatus Limnocylindrales bacterium]|nr:ABC transporter ATP-binding protein [Candidatus Limnocylindrales bacterium]